jgi:ribosomal protein L37AE/L43A
MSRPVDLSPPPECPACDTALAPEPIAPGVWACPCCAHVFQADVTHEQPQTTIPGAAHAPDTSR